MIALFLVTLLAAADNDAPRSDTVSSIADQLEPFQTIHGTFKQRKKIKILQKPLVSSGTFVLAKNKGLLWHTTKPFDSTLRIAPSGIAELKDGKVNFIVSTREQPGMKQVGELLLAVFSGDLHVLDLQFNFEDVQAPLGVPWRTVLRPRDPNVAKFVVSITLRGQKTAQSLMLFEANGDATEIHFNDLSLDARLSDAELGMLLKTGPT